MPGQHEIDTPPGIDPHTLDPVVPAAALFEDKVPTGVVRLDPNSSEAQQERRWFYHSYRQAFGRNGSAYGLGRTINQRWAVDCVLPNGTKRRLGAWDDFEDGLKVQDYCVQRDTAVKMCLIELYEHGNPDPLEKLVTDARTFGQLPRRRVRVTLEVDVEMRGTDEEIKTYLLFHLRGGISIKAARVTGFEGPRIKEPELSPAERQEQAD